MSEKIEALEVLSRQLVDLSTIPTSAGNHAGALFYTIQWTRRKMSELMKEIKAGG